LYASAPRRRAGVSLFEMVIAIVVIGVALAGVLSVYVATTRRSADPMVQQQAQFVAEAYLEEILLKRFYDPDTGAVCTGTTVGESRGTYDNVCDFSGHADAVPRDQFGNDQFGNPPSQLTGYSVSVAVDTNPTLGTLNNVGAVRVVRVDVTVTGPNGVSITLSGYRTNYNCSAGTDPGCRAL
jgi:MSHA pilin protein MshD